jgi:hypothetical protein
MAKSKQSTDKNASRELLLPLVQEAEAEARAYWPTPPKDTKPTPWTKTDTTVVKADGTRVVARGAGLSRVVPFDPDKFVDRIPRDELLKPIPVGFALQQDKYWRSFGVPKNELDGSTSRSLAWILLATCLLVQNDPDLTPTQLLVLGHNIGALRMMMRMYGDQRSLIGQARHANDYHARRRTVELFDSLQVRHPRLPLTSDRANVTSISSLVIEHLEAEGLGIRSVRQVSRWRREAIPKAKRKRGARRKT